MQCRQNLPAEAGEQRQEPDWELATYAQRVEAWLLDCAGITLPPLLLFIGFLMAATMPAAKFLFERFWYWAFPLVMMIGYIVWWLIALRRGQTPGKRIMQIRVIKGNGEPSGWGYTFLREFVIKFLLVGLLSQATLGIAWILDCLWPLWDRSGKMQTLHDKLLGTIVVRNR